MESLEVGAVILAAGTSRRMGRPKQLLDLGGVPILEHVLRRVLTLPFPEVVAVIGCEAQGIQEAVSVSDPRFHWVFNSKYREGQSTSLRVGLTRVRPLCPSAMVFLGDMPLISEETVQAVWEAGRRENRRRREPFAVQPVFQEQLGHPVYLGNIEKMDFNKLRGDRGARSMIGETYWQTVTVEDFGSVFDVDTPQAYAWVKTRV